MNQTHTSGRVASAREWRCIYRVVSGSLKSVRTSVPLALLLAKRLHNELAGLAPVCIKIRSITRSFPISMGQTDGVTKRIDLPFTLAELWPNARPVSLGPG